MGNKKQIAAVISSYWLVLLRVREALMFLPVFGMFLSVVSAFVMSHKRNRRPLVASTILRIFFWRQVVSVMALITFG